MKISQKQDGFHIIELIIVLAVTGLIGLVGFMVFRKSDQDKNTHESLWTFDQQKLEWSTTSQPPACPEPFKFDHTPVDISQVSGVLFPGAYRGFNYKPHGGFGVQPATQGNVDVKMPMDGTLVGLTRYYEGEPPELQYLITFENNCGIAFRFDHFHTLSPRLQALAEQTPKPKLNDTRSSPDDQPPRTKFKAGEVIATRVGLPSMNIFGFDFGVYDYRKRNEISKNSEWKAIHGTYPDTEWYAVCWFDMLPGSDPDTVKPLALAQTDTRRTVPKVSDYCTEAPHRTLEFNNGKPVDG